MVSQVVEQLGVFSQYIKKQGLRMTRQRELVVTVFLTQEGHLSTDELYELVRGIDSRVGYTTVFRTLKALTACGLARETDLNDGRTRFEHLYKHPHHHHVVCSECSHAIEFFSPELERLQEEIVAKYNFKPIPNRFQIFGICPACQNQEESKHEVYQADLVFARDALRIAMETEKRGMKFYKAASEIVKQSATRSTFLTMLADEKEHLRRLKQEWKRLIAGNKEVLEAPVFLHFDYDALKKIFPSRIEIGDHLKRDLSEEEALKLAMNMERDAQTFFRQYAEKFTDTKGRDIFLKFAQEEEEHYSIIREAYEGISSGKKAPEGRA